MQEYVDTTKTDRKVLVQAIPEQDNQAHGSRKNLPTAKIHWFSETWHSLT